MKKILKNKKTYKFITRTIATLCAFTVFGVGGLTISANHTAKQYSPESQMVEIAETLDCDISYMKLNKYNKIVPLQHNNNKPIYVSISDAYSKKNRNEVISTLDHIFGFVNEINSHYYYLIVTETELSKYNSLGLTTIQYKIGDTSYPDNPLISDSSGINVHQQNIITTVFANKPLKKSSVITITPDAILGDDSQAIILHETLHSFGFDDVYPYITSVEHYNSAIHPINRFPIMTPNDYKCLIATYSPNFLNNDEKTEFIEKFSNKILEYEKYYYGYITNKKNYQPLSFSTKEFCFKAKRTYSLIDKTIVEHNYQIDVKNDKYTFSIFDENFELLDKTSGKTLDINGVIYLKDVKLKHGLQPNNPSDENKETIVTLTIGESIWGYTLFNSMMNDFLSGSVFYEKSMEK